MAAPLEGITVIEVANYVAAPSVGALMRDLGADVIKVEPPGGEVMRGTVSAGAGPYHMNFLFDLENRGKRSITIALDKPGGPELVHDLLGKADVLLTNLILPRLQKYGLMPDEVLRRNPHVIHCSVTGYGLRGPDAARPGFDYAAFWARAGVMSVIGHPGQPPVLSRIAQGDHTTGMNTLAAIFAALRLRDLTGQGQSVEVSLQQTGVYTLATDFSRALVDGKQPSRLDRENPPNPLFNSYETKDGEWIMLVHMTPDPYWPKLAAMLNRPEWATDERYVTMRSRMEYGPALAAVVQADFLEQDMVYWKAKLDEFGLIWAPMTPLPEVIKDPQLAAMNAFQEIPHPHGAYRTVGVPFQIAGADIGVRGASAEPGEHTQQILAEAGIPPERIAELAANRVFG
jgi:crotonobetainyl-CoA:carnitine CoA-transferase CaiB-like acyl-CoA transferase